MPKGKPNKRYAPEFKIMVVETMHKEGFRHREAEKRFEFLRVSRAFLSWHFFFLPVFSSIIPCLSFFVYFFSIAPI